MFKFEKITNKNTGFGLIEVMVGVTVLTVSLYGISFFFQKALETSRETGTVVQASFLLEEGFDAIKSLRDGGWQASIVSLSVGTDYYLNFTGTVWETTTTNTFVDGFFERKFVLGNVYRDVNDDIAPSGNLDAGSRLVTVTVSWNNKGATTTRSMDAYVADIFAN